MLLFLSLILYAASKKSNELMAHTYSHLFSLPTTGLRFFTVYGPWGRPDMALFKFTNSMLKNKKIQLFNFGKHKGKLVEQVLKDEPSYFAWMANGDFPLHTKKVLQEIKLRMAFNR